MREADTYENEERINILLIILYLIPVDISDHLSHRRPSSRCSRDDIANVSLKKDVDHEYRVTTTATNVRRSSLRRGRFGKGPSLRPAAYKLVHDLVKMRRNLVLL